jgi:hypothetical protein
VVIPSQGPTVSRVDLQAFRTKIETLVSRASELVSRGVPQDQLMGQLKTEDLGWKLHFTPEQVSAFYTELNHKPQPLVAHDSATQ